jgi:metal-sulfur cluster biosynthetic enzyme
VNIYELGLIYEVEVSPDNKVKIVMTLTTPNCPAAEFLPTEVQQKVAGIEGVADVDLRLTFDPPWEQSMMSEAARLELGLM